MECFFVLVKYNACMFMFLGYFCWLNQASIICHGTRLISSLCNSFKTW